MPIDPTSKPIPGPNVPLWRRPLFAVLVPEFRNKDMSAGEIQKQVAEPHDNDLRDMFPSKLKWLSTVLLFLLKQNLISAAGIGGIVIGLSWYITSLLKPLFKWGGITLGGLGIIAAIGGKLCGISLKAPSSGAATQRSSSSSDDDIAAAAVAGAGFAHDSGHDGHGDGGHDGGGDCGDASFV